MRAERAGRHVVMLIWPRLAQCLLWTRAVTFNSFLDSARIGHLFTEASTDAHTGRCLGPGYIAHRLGIESIFICLQSLCSYVPASHFFFF